MFPKVAPTVWFQLAIAFVLLPLGCSHSIKAQPLPSAPSVNRSPNPKVNIKYITAVRRDERSEKPSPASRISAADEKRQAIEQAINQGNEARDSNEYEGAVAHYEKVAKELDPKDARAHYGLGNVYTDLACTHSAIGEYREAIRLKKDFHDALIALGYAYANKDRYDEADRQFNEVLRVTPNDAGAKIGLAFVLAKRKNYESAVSQLKIISDNHSIAVEDRAIAHLVLGDVYAFEQKWDLEADEYRQTIVLNPNIARAYLSLGAAELLPAMNKFGAPAVKDMKAEERERIVRIAKQATEHIRQAIYEHNYNHPLGYWYLAVGQLQQFNFRGAEANLNTYLAKVRDLEDRLSSISRTRTCDYGFATLYAQGYRYLGYLYAEEGFFETDERRQRELLDQSMASFKRVLEVKPDDGSAYTALAGTYLYQGNFPQAIENYEKALVYETNESNKASLYGTVALAYSSVGRSAEAIDYLNRAIKLQPNESTYYYSLALVFQRQEKFDQAIGFYQKGIDNERPPTARSYTYLATAYFLRAQQTNNEGDYLKAIEAANKAIEINPTYADGYLWLGEIYEFYKAGSMMKEAITNYELAARYDEKNPLVYYSLGRLYGGVNDEAAVFNLKKAISLRPEYSKAYWELGLVYRHMHNDPEAIKQLLEAIKYDDKFLSAYVNLASIYRAQKNYSEATKYLSTAKGFAPNDFAVYKELAKLYEAQGLKDEAIQSYDDAIKHLTPNDTFAKELYLCRIERLRGRFADAIACFQKINVPGSEDAGATIYDIGLTYVAAKNKQAAFAQYEQLKKMKSSLADDLMGKINDMK